MNKTKYDGLPFVVALDFDGTIAVTKFPEIIGLNGNVAEFSQDLKDNGIYVILWTCRNNETLEEAIQFCKENNVHFDIANEHCPAYMEFFNNKHSPKVHANIYIDDKNHVGLDKLSWADIAKGMQEKYGFKFPRTLGEV